MAGTIIVSSIKTDTDNSFIVRSNTGATLFSVDTTSISIPDGSITSAMIADGTVIAADVADGSITDAKIAAVANTKITGLVTAAQIANVANTQITGLITASQIASINASNVSTGTIPSSNLPAGSVLQVVNAVTSTLNATTGGTLIDTNLTASITPSSSSNKILVLVNQFGGKDGNCAYKIRLLRGSTDIGGADYIMFTNTVNSVQGFSYSLAVLDSPATTSSTTYKTQIALSSGSGTVYSQVNNGQSSITLMEIKG